MENYNPSLTAIRTSSYQEAATVWTFDLRNSALFATGVRAENAQVLCSILVNETAPPDPLAYTLAHGPSPTDALVFTVTTSRPANATVTLDMRL